MRDLLRNLEEAREIHVPVKELPDSLRSALKRVKYGSRDIGVVAQDKVEPNPYAAEGQKGFVLVIDIASGRSRDLEGSWGGASYNGPQEIDFANRPVPIPEGGAVIIGTEGWPQTMASIYVHPKTIAAMLPPAAETTEREQTILRTIRSLNSAGRKEVFGREKVTPAEIDALVARGLLSKTKAGAVSITTAGKNVAEDQEDGMKNLLRKLTEGYGRMLFDDDVDLGDLLEFAKVYSNMGSAIQKQMHDLVDWGGDSKPPELNGNAVRYIQEKMGRMHPMIAELCDAWKNSGEED